MSRVDKIEHSDYRQRRRVWEIGTIGRSLLADIPVSLVIEEHRYTDDSTPDVDLTMRFGNIEKNITSNPMYRGELRPEAIKEAIDEYFKAKGIKMIHQKSD